MATATMSIDDFLDRLSTVESGGDANSVNNSSGAAGLFQIMPANWEPWARAAGVDPSDHSAAAQRKVAAHQVQQYYDKFGSWEAVAVAWYAGEGAAENWVKDSSGARFNHQENDGYLSVNQYVARVMGATPSSTSSSGSSTGTGTGAGNGTTTTPAAPTITAQSSPADIEAYIRTNYPTVAPFLANAEIRNVLFDSAINHKTADETALALQNTEYWKTHDAASQHYDYFLGTESPATIGTVTDKAKSIIGDLFANDGVQASDAQITAAAGNALRNGWIDTSGQVADKASLAKFGAFAVGLSGGPKPGTKIGVTVDQLRGIAKAYMVPMTDADLNTWAMNIETGRASSDQFQSEIIAHSKTLFQNDPDIINAISNGRSPTDYFAPIKNTIANTLEITPDQIDMTSPQYSSVAQMYDPQAKVRRAMTLGEAQQWARDQPGFKNTQAYRDQDAQFGMQLAKTFGAIA